MDAHGSAAIRPPLTWADGRVTVSQGETEVTFGKTPPNIGSVRYWTEQMLTKRRAVDFGRLAASLCPAA